MHRLGCWSQVFMYYLTQSKEKVGYKVRVWHRPAFNVVGFTHRVPANATESFVPEIWKSLKNDGRLQLLSHCTPIRPWILGLASWDSTCEENGYRYTICIEQTSRVDLSSLRGVPDFFIKEIGASDWMHFELTDDLFPQQFWNDNPHKMLSLLGYAFNMRHGDESIGLHFDAYPPDYDPNRNPRMEFWITVREAGDQLYVPRYSVVDGNPNYLESSNRATS